MSIINQSVIPALRHDLAKYRTSYTRARKDLACRNRTPILADLIGLDNKGYLMAACRKAKKLLKDTAYRLACVVCYMQQEAGRQPSMALMAIIAERMEPITITNVDVPASTR